MQIGEKFSKRVENAVGKGEIACYKQFLLFPVFSKDLYCWHVKTRACLRTFLQNNNAIQLVVWEEKIFKGFLLWLPWQPEFFIEHNYSRTSLAPTYLSQTYPYVEIFSRSRSHCSLFQYNSTSIKSYLYVEIYPYVEWITKSNHNYYNIITSLPRS